MTDAANSGCFQGRFRIALDLRFSPHTPMSSDMKAHIYLGILLTCGTGCAAADIFAPQARVDDSSAKRIEVLEKRFEEAIGRMEKNTAAPASDAVSPDLLAGTRLPPPPGGKSIPVSLVEAPAKPEVQERVLGVMNGFEIYVKEGQVKRRLRQDIIQ